MRRGETLAAAGRMAVGLAHEVRNPLGAIRGAVQLLKRELGADSRLGEYTDVLLTEVDRVNRIIEMLLDLARPVQLRPVPLNLHQLLERVTMLNEEGARERGVTLLRRYDPSLPPILGDEDRLLQVFHNLVRNALDAMGSGGRPRARAGDLPPDPRGAPRRDPGGERRGTRDARDVLPADCTVTPPSPR